MKTLAELQYQLAALHADLKVECRNRTDSDFLRRQKRAAKKGKKAMLSREWVARVITVSGTGMAVSRLSMRDAIERALEKAIAKVVGEAPDILGDQARFW